MKVTDFKPGDRVVYRPEREEGTVTSVNKHWVFVCYGLPGDTSQATDPRDLDFVAHAAITPPEEPGS